MMFIKLKYIEITWGLMICTLPILICTLKAVLYTVVHLSHAAFKGCTFECADQKYECANQYS